MDGSHKLRTYRATTFDLKKLSFFDGPYLLGGGIVRYAPEMTNLAFIFAIPAKAGS